MTSIICRSVILPVYIFIFVKKQQYNASNYTDFEQEGQLRLDFA